MRCYRCGNEVARERIGVRDVCERCAAYLHCCRSCEFYDLAAANACREPNAERVADKEQGNFCDYFRPARAAASPETPRPDAARARLEALFAKKGGAQEP